QPPDPGILRDQRRNRFGWRQMNRAAALFPLPPGEGAPKGRERVRPVRDAADFGEPSSGAAKDARDFSPDASRQAEASRLKPLPHPSRHHQRGAMAITIAIML